MTDEAPALDVRVLSRDGWLDVPKDEERLRSLWWTRGGRIVGGVRVGVYGTGGRWPDDVELAPLSEAGAGRGEFVRLAATPCTFGGSRPWFVCPGCGTRRAVLRLRAGRFACAPCHRLAYGSSRESAAERACRRANLARARLGAEPGPARPLPPKPPGLHGRTYRRHLAVIDGALREIVVDLDRTLARFGPTHGEG